MDAKDPLTKTDVLHTALKDDVISEGIKRELDSLDDFEHLTGEDSPVKDTTVSAVGEVVSQHAREIEGIIDKGVETASAVSAAQAKQLVDNVLDPFFDHHFDKQKVHQELNEPSKMDTNLMEMGDAFPDRKEADAKLDRFLNEMSSFAPPKDNDYKTSTLDFLTNEKGGDLLDRYSDSDPEDEKLNELPEIASKDSVADSFKDFEDFIKSTPPPSVEKFESFARFEPEPRAPELFTMDFAKPEPNVEEVKKMEFIAPEPIIPSLIKIADVPEPVVPEVKLPQPPNNFKQREFVENIKKEEQKIVADAKPNVVEPVKKAEVPKKKDVIEAEAMFCKMGLVESLIYWRDPKKSGPVFGVVLAILLSLKFFSLISVIAYVSLLAVGATITFRIYKNIVQAIQKTGDGHPFKDYLEADVALPQQKVEEVTKVAVAHLNAAIVELRRLFLVDDLVDSIKFAVLLWCFTYLGAWFNGITLIILAWVALFSLPKVYETNKTQIDANLDIVKGKLAEITTKVKAAIPIGKKSEEKKE